jgi:uncharacterized protein (TIGR03435 family)
MRRLTILCGLSVLVFAAGPARSQSPQKPTFEITSVKPIQGRPGRPEDVKLGCHGTDSRSPGINIPRNRCVARFESLRRVVALAYDIPPALLYPYEGKLISGPDWIDSAMYEIEGIAGNPSTMAELKIMLQGLLVERFKLKTHYEKQEMPVYAMVRGKNPLKLTPAPADRECGGQQRHDHRYELGATSLEGQCHGFVPDNGALSGRSVDMDDFSEMLAIWAGRAVINRTGIDGLFDLKMPRLAPANAAPIAIAPREMTPGQPPPPLPAILSEPLPTVFEALEQIGLKLESSRGPVEVLVIDHIERPSQN